VTDPDLDVTVVAMDRWPLMKSGKIFPAAWDLLNLINRKIIEVIPGTIICVW